MGMGLSRWTSRLRGSGDLPEVVLSRAFPYEAQAQATRALRGIPRADLAPLGYVPSSNEHRYSPPRLDDTRLLIPYRIYNPPPAFRSVASDALPFVSTIYTRHHDGHVRQASTGIALSNWHSWMSPFVVQLMSEYVVEIANDIVTWLATAPDPARDHLQRFAAGNPAFIAISRARATSYWNEYYRGEFQVREYPPLVALREITGTWR
jgi:hypothetical protein